MAETYATKEEAIEAALVDAARAGDDRAVIHQQECATGDDLGCDCVPLTLTFGARA